VVKKRKEKNMPSPHVECFLTEHLQGHRSADETGYILQGIDDGVYKGADLVAEFDSVLSNVAKKTPGLAIDFDKLLSGDEIECDPLISQGNLALLRLDAIYYQAFTAWTKSGNDIHQIKIIRKPENPAKYAERTQQHIHTEENYPPDAQLLNQITGIILAGFRVQATITHRRDQLKISKLTGIPIGMQFHRAAAQSEPPSQPEASARNSSRKARFDERFTSIRPLGLLKGLQPVAGFSLPDSFPLSAPSASPRETPFSHPQYTAPSFNWNDRLPPGLEEELAQEESSEEESVPTYSKPPFESEKIHLYPPFAPASEEDAQEIEAYLKTLPPELQTAKTVGAINDNVEAPIWRADQSEHDWLKAHAKIQHHRALSQPDELASSSSESQPEALARNTREPSSIHQPLNRRASEEKDSPPQPPSEENLVTVGATNKVSLSDSLSAGSASPRETDTFTHNQPAFYKRE
jgi:hypothetical protein